VGLRPDVACRPAAQALERFSPGRVAAGRAEALGEDPCVRAALQQLAAAAAAQEAEAAEAAAGTGGGDGA
jgi:hypothetical protein